MSGSAHPDCHGPLGHVCSTPSGRPCIQCGRPAGTPWGPLWCPDCDEDRLNRVNDSLRHIITHLQEGDTR